MGDTGLWNYKNTLRLKEYDAALLDEFGNFHFGMTAAVRGYTLGFTHTGAGTYQRFHQDKSPLAGVLFRGMSPVTVFISNSIATMLVNLGFQFGDDPGDFRAIARGGWNYNEKQ